MLVATVFPVIAAFCFALSHLFVKLGMDESNPTTAVTINLIVNSVGLWILTILFSPIQSISIWSIWPFVVGGLFAPGLARSLLYEGYKHMGLARSDVIVGAHPLYTVLMAMAVLGERPTIAMIFGTFGIIGGIWLLVYRPDYSRAWKKWAVLLPFGAGLFFSFREIFSKMGLNGFDNPLAGGAIMTTVATGSVFALHFVRSKKEPFKGPQKSILFFVCAGLLVTVAYILIFYALRTSMVSLVSPLLGVHPLFSLFLSYLFLQSTEHVTTKVILGGLLVGAGAAAIVLGRV